MDAGQTIHIISQLSLGAIVTFLAILLWPKTRDAAWMLVIVGTIVTYIEIVYSILNSFGIGGEDFLHIGTVSLIAFILPILRMVFFIAAFLIMVIRQSRQS